MTVSSVLAALFDRYEVSAAVRAFVSRPHNLFIGGQWRAAASGERLDVFEPSTGEKLTTLAAGGAADIDLAVTHARNAMEDGRWSRLPPAQRERCLLKLVDLIEADAQTLATIDTIDNGKPISASRGIDVPDAIRFARYMAGWATKIDGRSMTLSSPDTALGMTIREPVGVVGAITPWNFPLNMALQKLMPALTAGCSVVLKPAEQTSLSALRLGELVQEAGIPDGVVAIVTGLGPSAGEALARHPGIAKLTFTGSTVVGTRIAQLAMANVTRVTLELGGKSPMIVFPDCDIERAAQGVVDGIFFNAGQVCCAASRLYVHRDIHEALLASVVARAEALRMGPGLNPLVDLGPLVSARQRDSVGRYIEIGRSEGNLLTRQVKSEGNGYFVAPAVLSGIGADSAVMREEVFGPVVTASTFADDAEVLRMANDTRYGLAASIWSNDLTRVRRLAGSLRAGTIWVNAHNPVDPALPFGGFGLSGFGREGGPENLDSYLETKSLWIS